MKTTNESSQALRIKIKWDFFGYAPAGIWTRVLGSASPKDSPLPYRGNPSNQIKLMDVSICAFIFYKI